MQKKVYVPTVTALRYAPIRLTDDCPECHVTLKLCFCDSSLWPSCADPAAYSVEARSSAAPPAEQPAVFRCFSACLLYTSDAADE